MDTNPESSPFKFVLVEAPDPNSDIVPFAVDSAKKVPQLRLSLASPICSFFRSTTKPTECVDVLLFADIANRAIRLERIGNRGNYAAAARKIQFGGKRRNSTGRIYYSISKELASALETINHRQFKIGAKDANGITLVP